MGGVQKELLHKAVLECKKNYCTMAIGVIILNCPPSHYPQGITILKKLGDVVIVSKSGLAIVALILPGQLSHYAISSITL